MALTDTAIRAARPGATGYKLSDMGGLQLYVSPAGSKVWRWKFRVGGKERLLTIGAYPAIGLAAARRAMEDARALLKAGGDPSVAKKEVRRAQAVLQHLATETFNALADEYLEKLRREKKAEATLAKVEWLLGFARPHLGNRAIREIGPTDVLVVLRELERRGRLESARRARSTIGAVFRLAVATGRADRDPTFGLNAAIAAPTVTPRAAITDAQKFGALLRCIDGFDGRPETRIALLLMALLVPRPGELRQAQWSEFDLAAKLWTIPKHRAKMRRDHAVPLASQAISLLAELRALELRGDLLFPCVRSASRPMSENTLNAALRRLGYGADEATAHGFRASFSTMANESKKWHPDAIERQLAHVEANDVRRAYDRGDHWDERIAMMQWWAGHLDALRRSNSMV